MAQTHRSTGCSWLAHIAAQVAVGSETSEYVQVAVGSKTSQYRSQLAQRHHSTGRSWLGDIAVQVAVGSETSQHKGFVTVSAPPFTHSVPRYFL